MSQEDCPESGDAQDEHSAPAEADVLAAGRLVPYSMLPDWVPLSGISPPAQALYWQLALHVAHGRGDRVVFPSRGHLARRLSFRQARSVDRYIDELVEIGAIDKYTGRTADRMRTRNYYVLHMAAQRCNNCLRYALQWRASAGRYPSAQTAVPVPVGSVTAGPSNSRLAPPGVGRPFRLTKMSRSEVGTQPLPLACVPTPRRL
ncbi:hypothetical protein AB0H37_43115 [Actinomadura sp. NPDC023710]|uniref:hypothetical protein n=1 Tax=Actinomadura sp. NPDC023710 TaxID=3158219 RepID=UPI0033F5CFD3